MGVDKFAVDINGLAERACRGDDQGVREKVSRIADVLVGLHRKNLVKINHSALELVCARSIIKRGYSVKVEHRLDEVLVCDVLGLKGDGRLIVEIETGFIPPEAALEPSAYVRARIASKISRYSRFAESFALGTTPSYVLDIPEFFVKPPGKRAEKEASDIKRTTDVIYNDPPISLDDLMHARLNSIVIIDVDSATTHEVDPGVYMKTARTLLDRPRAGQGLNPQRHAIQR